MLVPQQARSRESFARVLAATVTLLIEKGPRGVTIAGVSELAGVSVGSIYGRFGSRAALLRVAQKEELRRITDSMLSTLASLTPAPDPSTAVHQIVSAYVSEMRAEGGVIRALVALGETDDAIADDGPAAFSRIRDAVLTALQKANDSWLTEDRWGAWVFEVMFALTLRFTNSEFSSDSSLDEAAFISNLGHTVASLASTGPPTDGRPSRLP